MGQQQGQQGDLVAQEWGWGCWCSWEAVDGETMNMERLDWCLLVTWLRMQGEEG